MLPYAEVRLFRRYAHIDTDIHQYMHARMPDIDTACMHACIPQMATYKHCTAYVRIGERATCMHAYIPDIDKG